MATTLEAYLPAIGKNVSAIVFSMVALFETVGPFAAHYAFRISGEIHSASDDAKAA